MTSNTRTPGLDALATVQAQASPAGFSEEAIAAEAARRKRRRRILIHLAQFATLVVIIGGWQLFTSLKIVDPFFFGQPSGIVMKFIDWVQNGTEFGTLQFQIWVTMKEALLGFLYGVIGGGILGVLLGQIPFLSAVLSPYIKIVNAIPRIVLGSIFVVWLGLGTLSKVLLAGVLVFFVVFFNAFQGASEVDKDLVANARVLGATRLQVVRHVVLPSALTWFIASLHVAFGFAIIGAVVGEFLGAQQGLGLVISSAQNHFDPNGVFAAMFLLGAMVLVAEFVLGQLERRLLSWRPPSNETVTAT